MPLEWKPATTGNRKVDCYADLPDGTRFFIRETTFGNEPSFHLKECGALVAICDTLDETKQKAAELAE